MDVRDLDNAVQSVIDTAQEIAKFVEMINNQVQQIETLTEQLDEFKHCTELFGAPNAVVLTTVLPLVNDPRKTELGQTLADLEGAVDAGEAMLYSANGLFTSIGTTFTTPNRTRAASTLPSPRDASIRNRARSRIEGKTASKQIPCPKIGIGRKYP